MSTATLRHLAAALTAVVLASCAGNSNQVAVLPKSSLNADALFGNSTRHEKFEVVAAPAPQTVAASLDKPRDRHKMPVYQFSDRTRVVRTTAYTHTEADHLIYGRKNAAGTTLRYDRVRSAAADWSIYPVGTTFRIKGLPYLYVIDDYGSALTGTATVDLYKPSKEVMNAWGRRNVELTVVRWGSFNRSAEILKDRVHHAHCRQMFANIIRQRPDLAHLAKR